MKSVYYFTFAFAAFLSVAPIEPVEAQRTKQWAADWSRCISHDSEGFRNNCTQSMEVFWLDTGGHHNTVTIRAGARYPGGGRPVEIYACLSGQGNRFDWDARRCWYLQ